MFGVYSRPLAVLREVNRQLNNDLMDIDLYSLRYETLNTPGDEMTKGRWVRLLNMVSPLLVTLGREFDMTNDAIDKQIFNIQVMMGMISLTMMIVALIVTFIIVMNINDNMTVIGLAEAVFQVMFVFLIVGMLARVLVISIGEQIHYLEHERSTAVHQALRFFKNELSDNEVVKLAAAKITGTENPGRSKSDTNDDSKPKQDATTKPTICGSDKPNHVPTVDEAIEISCTKDRERVLVALQHVKSNYDRFDKIAIVASIQSRFNTLSRLFEKSALNKYANKTTIPSIVRSEIAPLLTTKTIELHMLEWNSLEGVGVAGSAVAGSGPIKDSLVSTSRHETKAAAWRMFSEGAKQSSSHLLAIFFQERPDGPKGTLYILNSLTPLEAYFQYRRKNAGPRNPVARNTDLISVAMAMPVESQKIYISGSVPAKTDVGAMGFDIVGTSSQKSLEECRSRPDCDAIMGGVMMRFNRDELTLGNVFDQVDVVGNTEKVTIAVRMDVQALYTQSITSGDAAGRFLLDQKEFLAVDIANVAHKYEFSFQLSDNRKAIETELMKFYGTSYDAHIRRIALGILRLADQKITDLKKSPLAQLASEHDLRTKIIEMTDAEWEFFMSRVLPLADSMKDQQNNFPKFFSWRGKRVRTTLMGFLVPIAVIILLLSYTLILDGFISNLTTSFWDTFAITIFIPAVIAVVMTVFETLAKKSISITERHHEVLKQNTSDMVGSTSLAIGYLVAFRNQGRQKIQSNRNGATDATSADGADGATDVGNASQPLPPQEANTINLAKMAIIKFHDALTNFRRCNNLGLSDKSYDSMAEIVLYSLVFAVFLAIAVYVAMKLDPMSSINNIKQLATIRNLIDSGELHPNMFGDAFDMSACMVPLAPAAWVMKLFGAVIFLCLAIWFMAVSQTAEDTLRQQIEGMRECEKILSV